MKKKSFVGVMSYKEEGIKYNNYCLLYSPSESPFMSNYLEEIAEFYYYFSNNPLTYVPPENDPKIIDFSYIRYFPLNENQREIFQKTLKKIRLENRNL
ncbi:MAG: hypothetical protein Q7S27_07225 [Nanoarchaeota archaeon]|nr:hypothetical protein [Nanoarchaeota archaeon]